MRPRTLLAIAALAGAFYFLLPQIAQVRPACTAARQLGVAAGDHRPVRADVRGQRDRAHRIGARPVPFGPAVLAQGASSFINRVSPANVGGMALNARFLQKTETGAPASVAAVGVNALAGAIMHP